jgi:hypothetical protein
MNTNDFELAVAQHTSAFSLQWIMTTDGLRMRWTKREAVVNDEWILMFPVTSQVEYPPAVA